MTQIRPAALAAVLLTFACGASNQQQSEDLATSHAALCAGAPEVQGDYVTIIACPFEQQVHNIVKYGDQIDTQSLFDAAGNRIGNVTNSCDSWWLGQDESGLDILLDSSTG
ncbi:MAG TPA: hypothetical protein VG963_22685, partial [Polyangiaceae bacterium]|nr:hypothetical protein [Polyangiaceae bacterium]